MLGYALLALVGLGAVGLALWALAGFVLGVGTAVQLTARSVREWWCRRAALAAKKKRQRELEEQRKKQKAIELAEEAAKRIEEERIAAYREAHPVKLIRRPDLQSLRKLISLLEEFIVQANSHRPKFRPTYDTKFRATRFSLPYDFSFPVNGPT